MKISKILVVMVTSVFLLQVMPCSALGAKGLLSKTVKGSQSPIGSTPAELQESETIARSQIDLMNDIHSNAAMITRQESFREESLKVSNAEEIYGPGGELVKIILPNDMEIDLDTPTDHPYVLEHHASGCIKSISVVLHIAWTYRPLPGGGSYPVEYARVTKVYNFSDEEYCQSSIGDLGKVSSIAIENDHGLSGFPTSNETRYTYWDNQDQVKVETRFMTGTVWTDRYFPEEEIHYNQVGSIIQKINYFYAMNTTSDWYLVSKTLQNPDRDGYVYYEYYNEPFSTDPYGNSVGRIKKARSANGSYAVFAGYWRGTNQARRIDQYGMADVLFIRTYYRPNGARRIEMHYDIESGRRRPFSIHYYDENDICRMARYRSYYYGPPGTYRGVIIATNYYDATGNLRGIRVARELPGGRRLITYKDGNGRIVWRRIR